MNATAVHADTPITADNWRRFAACAGLDGDLFFPRAPHAVEGQVQIMRALDVCRSCPVQPDCLAAFLARDKTERRSQVIGGRWFSDRGHQYEGPPPAGVLANLNRAEAQNRAPKGSR